MKNKDDKQVTKQLKLFAINRPSIVRHEYDIDVFEIFDELKKKYSSVENKSFAKNNKLLQKIKSDENIFIKLMKQSGINLSLNRSIRHYILPSSNNMYHSFLGWKILVIDPYKIEALLSYQSVLFSGNYYAPKENFVGLVEFSIYEFVKYRNFFNENIRLEKMMNWVERNRIFIKEKALSKSSTTAPPKINDILIDNDFAKIFSEKFKLYFQEKDHANIFRLIVNGEKISGLCFNGNRRTLAELFKRLRYNKKIFVDNNTLLATWVCNSFTVLNKNREIESLIFNNIIDILNKIDKEPSKLKRILEDLAPFQTKLDRKKNLEAVK